MPATAEWRQHDLHVSGRKLALTRRRRPLSGQPSLTGSQWKRRFTASSEAGKNRLEWEITTKAETSAAGAVRSQHHEVARLAAILRPLA